MSNLWPPSSKSVHPRKQGICFLPIVKKLPQGILDLYRVNEDGTGGRVMWLWTWPLTTKINFQFDLNCFGFRALHCARSLSLFTETLISTGGIILIITGSWAIHSTRCLKNAKKVHRSIFNKPWFSILSFITYIPSSVFSTFPGICVCLLRKTKTWPFHTDLVCLCDTKRTWAMKTSPTGFAKYVNNEKWDAGSRTNCSENDQSAITSKRTADR